MYIDGFLIPVPNGNREAYRALAAKAAPIFIEHGALRVVECWGDNIPDGKVTDFKRAVKAEADENVVFSWVVYPSKEARDAAQEKIMNDERMSGSDMPFDGQRLIFGAFEPIVDHGEKA
ncbi:DUF1428 domain-containing protein [Sphingoaurantiacus capsulatus]|uniref:DUF1428 domain-containing protein n=1 Tax=Sphingoaurantiacus capsulatus TaxID=1771310 RepID=A0ABV7XD18_9SPHN